MTHRDDEIAALQARVDELERAAKPQTPPDMSDWQPINPIDRLSMPRSTMREMAAAIPDSMLREIVHDNSGPTGPTGMSPSSSQLTSIHPGGGPARVPGGGTGWVQPVPLGPSPHQRYVDQQIDAQDMKDRQELIEKKAREQALLNTERQP